MLLVMLCLSSVPVRVYTVRAAETSTSSTSKLNGLVKKGSARYYYVNGKMSKKCWKKVGKAKYYFRADGKAAVGSIKIKSVYYIFSASGKLFQPSSKKKIVEVSGTKYYVNAKGRAVKGWNANKNYYFSASGKAKTGVQLIGGKLWYFRASGKKNAAKSKTMQQYAKRNKLFSPLRKILGKPKKSAYEYGCYTMKDPSTGKVLSGKDGILTYKGFTVYTFLADNGKEYFVGVE